MEKEKRTLIDIQYFSYSNCLIVHEIVNGKTEFSTITDPSYDVYLARKSDPAAFFMPKEELDRFTIDYKNRYQELATILGSKTKLWKLDRDTRRLAERDIITNPRLYFADNNIAYTYINKYYKYYKEKVVYQAPKIMSFDIEVHNDYNQINYKELSRVIGIDSQEELLNFEFSGRTNINDYIIEKIDNYDFSYIEQQINAETPLNQFAIYIIAYFSHNKTNDKNITEEFLKLETIKSYANSINTNKLSKLQSYFVNIGFPDENLAASRIDAISAYDNLEKKYYIYLNLIPEDIGDIYKSEVLANPDYEMLIEKFMKVFVAKVVAQNDKKFSTNNPEVVENIQELFNEMSKARYITTDIEEKYDYIMNILQTNMPDLHARVKKVNVEIQTFDNELSLLNKFFSDYKEVIKPNFVIAHNITFDFLTIYNRLKNHYRTEPESLMAMVQFDDDDLDPEARNPLPITIKVDHNAKSKKTDNTYFKVPGCVWLDSLLLIAKSSPRERDFSLDAISRDYLKETKFEYDGSISELYTNNFDYFIKYSLLDTALVGFIEEYNTLILNYIDILGDSRTPWVNYSSKSVFLTNLIKKTLEDERGLITRVNLNAYNGRDSTENEEKTDEAGFEGAYVSNPIIQEFYGLHSSVIDCDAKAYYPSTIITINSMTDSIKYKIDPKLLNAYLRNTKLSFSSKFLGGSSIEEIYEKL